jgi:hypothetical protein
LELLAVPNPETAKTIKQTLSVYLPDGGVPLVSVQFIGVGVTSGTAGMRVIGCDAAGVVKLTTDVRGDRVKINLVSQDFGTLAPSALLPSLQLATALRPPNILVLTVKVGEVEVSEQQPIAAPFLNDPPDPDFMQFVEDVAVVQDRLRQYFPLPEVIEPLDFAMARRIRKLLDGERVRWKRSPVEVNVDADKIDEFKEQFADVTENALRMSTTATDLTLAGHKLVIGPFSLEGIASIDLDAVAPDADGVVTARFDIGSDGWMYGFIGGAFDDGAVAGESNVSGGDGDGG